MEKRVLEKIHKSGRRRGKGQRRFSEYLFGISPNSLMRVRRRIRDLKSFSVGYKMWRKWILVFSYIFDSDGKNLW